MKKKYTPFYVLSTLVLLVAWTFGSSIRLTDLGIGQVLETITPSNPASGKVKFYAKSDGKVYKLTSGGIESEMGSGGSGSGGQNFFTENPDAENGTNNWTNTGGGSFSVSGGGLINGTNSFVWDASAQNDVLRTDQLTIPTFFKGKSCEASFRYYGATSDLIKPQIIDSSNVKLDGATYYNQVDNSDFLQIKTDIVERSIYFICPTSGTIALEFNQTAVGNPAALNFDDVYVGELRGLTQTIASPDILVKGESNGGSTITANATNIDFTEVIDTDSAWNGTQFTVPEKGVYSITGNTSFSTAATRVIDLYVNAVQIESIGVSLSGASPHFSITREFDESEVISFRCRTSSTLSVGALNHWISIVKQNSSQDIVQTYTSIPKVAEILNTFSATITNGGSSTVASENTDWINGDCTRSAVGYVQCTLQTNLNITQGMSCTCSAGNTSATVDRNCAISLTSTTNVDIRTSAASSGSAIDIDVSIICQKQETDFKMPAVQPIIVGQVTNSKAEDGSLSNVRVEGCKIENTAGTPSTDLDICDTWIQSITDNGAGNLTLNLISGRFSKLPTCTLSTAQGSSGMLAANVTSTTAISILTWNATPSSSDRDFAIICIGER